MKKILGILLIIAIVIPCCLLIFQGCEEATDYEHTIVFYSSQGDALQAVTQNAIEAFEAKYPGWKVEHITPGGYDDVKKKVIADLQGNQQPDLAYCYADHVAEYLQTKKVVDLNDLINSEETVEAVIDGETQNVKVGLTAEEIDDIVKCYYDEGLAENYGGYAENGYTASSMLTLPFVKSTELLYYNKTILEENGLEPAQTWDELWEQCETLGDIYKEAIPLGYDSEANWFITMCAQNNWGYTAAQGSHYLFDNANTKAWLEQIKGYKDKSLFTTQTIYGAYTSALFTKGENGGCIYCIGSSGGASHQKPANGTFDYGIAPVPGSVVGTDDDGNPIINNSAISQGPSLVMLTGGKGSRNADEKKKMTFLFIKELLDVEFQAEFAKQSGYNPCRYSVLETQNYKDHLKSGSITAVAAQVASQMLAEDRFFTSPAFVGSSDARTQVGNVVVYVAKGNKTPADALKEAVKNCGGN